MHNMSKPTQQSLNWVVNNKIITSKLLTANELYHRAVSSYASFTLSKNIWNISSTR